MSDLRRLYVSTKDYNDSDLKSISIYVKYRNLNVYQRVGFLFKEDRHILFNPDANTCVFEENKVTAIHTLTYGEHYNLMRTCRLSIIYKYNSLMMSKANYKDKETLDNIDEECKFLSEQLDKVAEIIKSL